MLIRDNCDICGGDKVVETKPAGAGYADDLPEYVPCPQCTAEDYECILCGEPMTEEHHCSPEGIMRYLNEVMPLPDAPEEEKPAPKPMSLEQLFPEV